MRAPARNIWEIKVQTVCSIVSAGTPGAIELWMCGNFGQASLDPPRVVINPNRLYPLEGVIRETRRFALNVISEDERAAAERLMRVRRREPNKAKQLGIPLKFDTNHALPYLTQCLRTLFCDVEDILDTGDHSLVIARIVEVRQDPEKQGASPVLFPSVSDATRHRSAASRATRSILARSGVSALASRAGIKDIARKVLRRSPEAREADLAANTYAAGGFEESELREIMRHGVRDDGKTLSVVDPVSIDREVSVCVVGTGAWGSYYASLIHKACPKANLYVCGRDLARAKRVAQATGAVDTVEGLDAALADSRFNALVLALPHHFHAEAAIKSADAGKHVLVEKPIATTVSDGHAMIESARRAGTFLMVAENFQFRPAIRAAVHSIERGDIGEPLYFSANAGGRIQLGGWKGDKNAMGGGVLMDIGIHYIRALRLLMGEPTGVMATKAMQVNTKISGEDSIQTLFSSAYGWQAQMLLNWVSPRPGGPDIVIAGERGTLHLWPGDSHIDLYHGETSNLIGLIARANARVGGMLAKFSKGRARRRLRDGDPGGYLGEIREFLSAVADDRPPTCGPEHGVRDVEIVARGYAALDRGEWISVPDAEWLNN